MITEMHLEKLKTLYPTFSPEELTIVKDTLDRYLLLAWEIYEALERNSQASLTPSSPSSSIYIEVDSPTN
jgi:hypothetical protein